MPQPPGAGAGGRGWYRCAQWLPVCAAIVREVARYEASRNCSNRDLLIDFLKASLPVICR